MRNKVFKSNKLVSTLHVLATTIICETLMSSTTTTTATCRPNRLLLLLLLLLLLIILLFNYCCLRDRWKAGIGSDGCRRMWRYATVDMVEQRKVHQSSHFSRHKRPLILITCSLRRFAQICFYGNLYTQLMETAPMRSKDVGYSNGSSEGGWTDYYLEEQKLSLTVVWVRTACYITVSLSVIFAFKGVSVSGNSGSQ